ncbi:MAG: hypothetical protein EP340_02150 [Alphaproteobacteria bacterium]|nr:MAG: hypothetical protein EP340_02150 [Alphaproteobacteria bacterium]
MKTAKISALTLICLAHGSLPAMSALDRNDPAYRDCLAQVEINPQAAFNMATAWKSRSGAQGADQQGADHCEARALIRLNAAKEGARQLDRLAANAETGSANLRAEIYIEAAQAWLGLNETETATTSLEAATALKPNKIWTKADLAITSAQVDLVRYDYASAEARLNEALELLPSHLDALILRAGARRHLEDAVGAYADLEFVLTEDPDNPDALLERGLLKKDFLDWDGARADLARVLDLAPGTAAAAKARNTLNILDLREENEPQG